MLEMHLPVLLLVLQLPNNIPVEAVGVCDCSGLLLIYLVLNCCVRLFLPAPCHYYHYLLLRKEGKGRK